MKTNFYYLILDIAAISIPLLLSSNHRVKLDKKFKALFTAITITALGFLIWDYFFTAKGYWGFTEEYLTGFYIFNLPIEEILFFICIPYACLFTHETVKYFAKGKAIIPGWLTEAIKWFLVALSAFLFIKFNSLAYTATSSIILLISLLLAKKDVLKNFFVSYILLLIPFFIINGILTGTGIESQIVWYNNEQNLGIRLLTIPVEDLLYAMELILINLIIFKKLDSR